MHNTSAFESKQSVPVPVHAKIRSVAAEIEATLMNEKTLTEARRQSKPEICDFNLDYDLIHHMLLAINCPWMTRL